MTARAMFPGSQIDHAMYDRPIPLMHAIRSEGGMQLLMTAPPLAKSHTRTTALNAAHAMTTVRIFMWSTYGGDLMIRFQIAAGKTLLTNGSACESRWASWLCEVE